MASQVSDNSQDVKSLYHEIIKTCHAQQLKYLQNETDPHTGIIRPWDAQALTTPLNSQPVSVMEQVYVALNGKITCKDGNCYRPDKPTREKPLPGHEYLYHPQVLWEGPDEEWDIYIAFHCPHCTFVWATVNQDKNQLFWLPTRQTLNLQDPFHLTSDELDKIIRFTQEAVDARHVEEMLVRQALL